MKEAVERWQTEQGMVDDITIIVAFLNVGQGATQNNSPNVRSPSSGAQEFAGHSLP